MTTNAAGKAFTPSPPTNPAQQIPGGYGGKALKLTPAQLTAQVDRKVCQKGARHDMGPPPNDSTIHAHLLVLIRGGSMSLAAALL
jgi:hypothetical protein